MHPRIIAQTNADHPAVIMSDGTGSLTFGELELLANQGAHFLRERTIRSGETIAICLKNCADFFVIYWAGQRTGLHIVPIPTHLTAAEVAYIVDDSEARMLVTDRPEAGIQDIIGELSALGTKQCEILGLEAWTQGSATRPDFPIDDEVAGFHMLYSSGTTGKPKGIKSSHTGGPACVAHPRAQAMGQTYGFNMNARLLIPAPLYHAAPLIYSTMAQRLGSTIVVMPKFDAEEVLRLTADHGITFLQLVPTMFVRMLNLPEATRTKYDLSSLTHILHSAAPCPVHVKQKMLEWLGPIIYETYAGSESNGSTLIGPLEWLERPGSVGRANLGTLRICDDAGQELPTGEDGMIYFEGGQQFQYWKNTERTKNARHPIHKDWSTLGDIGHVDAEGYLYLTDRKSFMIISGGVNIYPQEVENLLLKHPEVADAAVIGIPCEDMGEQMKAIIQPVDWAASGDALASRLMDFCRESLSRVKCPRSIDFERVLPREETGKLYKRKLRDRYVGT